MTASEYWRKHEALRKTEGQTDYQRREALKAFENEYATFTWRVKISNVTEFGTIEGWASKPGFWGEKWETPITVRFRDPKPSILATLNKGDICVVTGRPNIVEEYESSLVSNDGESHFVPTLYLEDASVERA